MRRQPAFLILLLVVVLLCVGTNRSTAADFKLLDGTTLSGEVIYMGKDGVNLKLSDGTYYPKRLKWEAFSQETLKEFNKNPKAAAFVELLVATAENIDEDKFTATPRPPKPPVNLDVKRSPGRPAERVGIIAALTSGTGWLVLGLLYGANLYSAFSVAFFRRRPWWMICGLAAVAPVATQAVFLALPAARPEAAPEQAAEGAQAGHEAQAMPVAQAMPIDPALMGAQPAFGAPGSHAGYAQAPVEAAPAPVALPPTQVYRRGEFNLNRRFIESKFSGFFRVIPSEADRDLLLVVKSARGEFVSRHIVRATNTEVVFQVPHESGTTTDTAVPLNDLFEIQVRHKDAPPQ